MTDPILVTVIGGYLGAGKTTLVNYILRSADERIAVLVNDFGTISVDAELIESDDGSTISLANGCICCSLVDGFGVALGTIRSTSPLPERLVIEASGVANPSQVAAYAHGPGFALDAVVTVVDAEQVRHQARNELVGDVVSQQIEAADLILLNKCDLVDDVGAVRMWLSDQTSAAIIDAVESVADLGVVLGLETRRRHTATPSTSHVRFETWTEQFDDPIERIELERRLAALPDEVVRAKGIVRFVDSPEVRSIVQVVGPRSAITEAGQWPGGPSTLTFISTASPDGRQPTTPT